MAGKKSIEVKILVNGNVAREYNYDGEERLGRKTTVTKYIEAISGAQFAVQFTLKSAFRFNTELMGFYLSIDGKELDGTVMNKADFEAVPRGRTDLLEGIRRSDGITWSLEKFSFADIKTSDEQSPMNDRKSKNKTTDIGTISVRVYRQHKGVYHKPGTKGTEKGWGELTGLGTLPEKTLKGQALSHSTSLGMPELVTPMGVWSGIEFLDKRNKPSAEFNFKYRSRKALQDLCIIERTPEPVPLDERPIEDLTLDEARELLQRQRERQASTVPQMKADIKPERGIKREYENDEEYSALLESARASKVPRIFEEGEVISLLED